MPPPSAQPVSLWQRKSTYLWLLPLLGIFDGVLGFDSLGNRTENPGYLLASTFAFNLVLLAWCFRDADEKRVPITRWLGLCLLMLAVVGVPWYFVRSRGWFGALKRGFGLGIVALYLAGAMLGLLLSGYRG